MAAVSLINWVLILFATSMFSCSQGENLKDIPDASGDDLPYVNLPPVFTSPSLHILDLSVSKSISFKVAVKDDDSVLVEMKALKSPAGSLFEVASPKSANFFWTPSPAQIEESPFYSLVVSAADGVNQPVIQEVGIMLMNAEDFGFCPGIPPLAVVSSLKTYDGSIEVSLAAVDADSRVKDATVFYTKAEPDVDGVQFESIAMTETGSVFSAEIVAGDAQAVVYFYFTVSDDDDMFGDFCDHSRRIPKAGFFAMSAGDCGHDSLEPNNVVENASYIEPGGAIPLPLLICSSDADFFKFFVKKGERVLFYLDSTQWLFPGNLTGFELEIRDANGVPVKSVEGDSIEFVAPESGYYYLLAGATAIGDGTSYYLHSYSLKEPCTPSDFNLQFGKEISFRLCEGEAKVFDLFLNKGDSFGAKISFESSKGDIDVGLFRDGEDLPVAVSDKKGDGENLKFDSPVAAGYKFVLKGWNGAGNMVKMTTDLKTVSEECSDDLFAPNGEEESAVMLPEGEYFGLKLCPGKWDYFAIGLNGGEELSLLAETSSQAGEIFTRIFNPDGTECGENISEGSSALSFCGAKVPGNYIFYVGSDSIYKIGYDMLIEVAEPQFCNPDRFEINDSPKSAPPISEGFTTHLTLCGGNKDYFSLNLPTMSLLSAYLFTDSEIEFSLLSGDDFSLLKQGIMNSGGEVIFFLVPKGGEYILKVEGQGEGVYDIGYIVESP